MNIFENNLEKIKKTVEEQGVELGYDDTIQKENHDQNHEEKIPTRTELDIALILKLNEHIKQAEKNLESETNNYKRHILQEDIAIQTETLKKINLKFSDEEIERFMK